jgi:uncharacterized protein YgiM (DUF1202 family)
MRSWKKYVGFIWIGSASVILALVFGASVFISMFASNSWQQGVLIRDEVVVRKGNAESFSPQFEQPVNQGLEFRVLEERPDWIHIELNNGESGWIRRSDAEIVSEQLKTNAANT